MTQRWTQADAREFALRLPETCEAPHRGRPSLRVRNAIFMTLPPDGSTINLKTTPLALDMLLRSGDSSYRDVWGGRWVGVDLAKVAPSELRGLIVEAYTLAAPQALAGEVRTCFETELSTPGSPAS